MAICKACGNDDSCHRQGCPVVYQTAPYYPQLSGDLSAQVARLEGLYASKVVEVNGLMAKLHAAEADARNFALEVNSRVGRIDELEKENDALVKERNDAREAVAALRRRYP